MKSPKSLRAIAALLLCVIGFLLSRSNPYREHIYLMDAGGCRLETSFLEPASGGTHGSVVLLHGLASNKKLMFYLAQTFTAQGLRVFVPDLPGHGRTAGPFSAERAEKCSGALVSELFARGLASPQQTILAGHSMGAAIAVRLAAHIPVAGIIAISPAPMQPTGIAQPEMLLYHDPPPLASNSLIINGSLELKPVRDAAANLQATRNDGTTKLMVLPWASHVSLIFDPRTARASQEWAARVLHLEGSPSLPSRRGLLGALAGFIGILLIAGPFITEACGDRKTPSPAEPTPAVATWRSLAEIALLSLLTAVLLHFFPGISGVKLFEGDYLASFLWILGVFLCLMHFRTTRAVFRSKLLPLVTTAFAALVLFILVTAWFELTSSESWLTPAKWGRFPLLLVFLFPYHLAEELLVGPVAIRAGWQRLAFGLSLRLLTWFALLVGLFALHSGEVLVALLAPYLALSNVFQRTGSDCVREGTGSPSAAALFGAILQAGFWLVIFPVT
jgi:pimeloyl-ACP methyl ester carboxylesterase